MRKREGIFRSFIALCISAVMVLSMLACGGQSGTETTTAAEGTKATEAQQKADAETEAAADETADEGISADSPYAGKGYDLSEHRTIVMYVLGDRPQDQDEVLEELNTTYLGPWLNAELQLEFLNWSDYRTKYSLILAGGDKVDLMYTASWCFYQDEVGKGAFLALTEDFLKQYMPYSYELQPEAGWDQAAVNGVVYGVPRTLAPFNGYNFVAVRSDMMEKYGFDSLDSWDDFEAYLKAVAQDTDETGISASAQNPTRTELSALWTQVEQINYLGSTSTYVYYELDSDDPAEAPDIDDLFFYYTSEEYREFAETMAELADAGCWSANAINETTDPRDSFANGTSASYSYNETIYAVGKDLEDAGLGTYEAYDITPDCPRARGSYADDLMAITTNSTDCERAALVLDALKAFPEVNNLIIGGIQGKHFDLNEDGDRVTLDGASGYAWDSWAWALQREDQPVDATMDQRQRDFLTQCEKMEYVSQVVGFSFDKSSVETELSVISSIITEYQNSFALGVYGDQTDDKLDEFAGKLEAAGVQQVIDEVASQYSAYCAAKGIEID